MSKEFILRAPYTPTGDQPEAIEALLRGIERGDRAQTLLGITGSGKTFTMANIIQRLQRPALIIAHNKTLTAQLAQEFREFFPDNAVHYFVSYYDYYQPEAYIAKTDTYIEKESTVNAEIDRLRHATTESLLTRRDVIIVASVSCIYGIGEREEYESQVLRLAVGDHVSQSEIIDHLISIQFKRTGADFMPGTFRVVGDTIDVYPASTEDYVSIGWYGDDIETIMRREYLTNTHLDRLENVAIFPARHFVTRQDVVSGIVPRIRAELTDRLEYFAEKGDLLRAERIKTRVEYDLEMLQEVGYVNGIENYSLYFSDRMSGDPATTLIDFFPPDFLTFIDESHMTIPQIGGMYAGDRARKESLIENGFRLPSAYDNRPLRFPEFESKMKQMIFVSATPSVYEHDHSSQVVEQIIRPTGLLDPIVEIEDMEYMVDSLMAHIRTVIARGERILITTLTKKSSEELSEYLAGHGIRVRYLHSEIETIDRLDLLRDLRLGKIDAIVGVNLLREGLDLPEVSFIAILDAEKVGFLRSTSALLQIIGRAARNTRGQVVMYASRDPATGEPRISHSMAEAIEITRNRRALQEQYNTEHGITPTNIVSTIKSLGLGGSKRTDRPPETNLSVDRRIKKLEIEMDVAATNLDFELAAELRDELIELRQEQEKKRTKRAR